MAGERRAQEYPGGLATAAVAALAIACCAGLPLLAALAGGVALGTVLGVGAGVVTAVALVAVVLARLRRRRRSETSSGGTTA